MLMESSGKVEVEWSGKALLRRQHLSWNPPDEKEPGIHGE